MNITSQEEGTPPLTAKINFVGLAEEHQGIPEFLLRKAGIKIPINDEVVGKRPHLIIVDDISETENSLVDQTETIIPIGTNEGTYISVGDEEVPIDMETATYIQQPTNLDDLSVEDLRKQEEDIQRRILEKQKAEKQAVIDQIIEVATNYSITVEDLVEAFGGLKTKRRGVKAVIKYQDPETGATWSGRGKEPSWIKDKDRTRFLIN